MIDLEYKVTNQDSYLNNISTSTDFYFWVSLLLVTIYFL